MSDNLPVRHPSEYVDPLEAASREEAIAVTKSEGVLICMGDDQNGEWIRFEQENYDTHRSNRHPDDTEIDDSKLSDPAHFDDEDN